MNYVLENSFYQFIFHPDEIKWDLRTANEDDPLIDGAHISASYRVMKKYVREFLNPPVIVHDRVITIPAHGKAKQLQVTCSSYHADIRYQVIFALPEEYPYLLMKLTASNFGDTPINLNRLGILNIGHQGKEAHKSSIQNISNPIFFSNGWGSWDYTGTYGPSDRFRRTRMGPFTKPMRVNPGTPHPSGVGHFSSDMFALLGDTQNHNAILFGFLSQKEQFGSIECRLKPNAVQMEMWANGNDVRLNPGKVMTTDWTIINFTSMVEPEPLSLFTLAVAREHGIDNHPSVRLQQEIPVGWCSWYEFFDKVRAQDIQDNIQIIKGHHNQLPLDFIQIDDGYQSVVGDWLDVKPTFPDGMKSLADDIKAAGLSPGLWLAPFIVHPKSNLAKEHSEWIVRGPMNRPANAGFSSWGVFTAGLDLTHPDALNHVRDVIGNAVQKWGYTYLKLDFLYAGAIKGRRYDHTRTLAHILRSGLEIIREAAGNETYLVGCGCPIGSGLGLVNSMRIGPDVDPHWMPKIFGLGQFLKKEPGLPSTRYSIHNTLTRAFMHKHWWINDPDCLLLREDMALTWDEIKCLATAIALSGGSLMLSDNLPSLSPARLKIAQGLLPLIGKRPVVPDLFDSPEPGKVRLDLENCSGKWSLLAYFNWLEKPSDINLKLSDYGLDPEQEYIGREYWSGKISQVSSGFVHVKNMPPHSVVLLSVRQIIPGEPIYVGSNLHISQGLEISDWVQGVDELKMTINREDLADGEVILLLPRLFEIIHINDFPCGLEEIKIKNCYRIRLSTKFD